MRPGPLFNYEYYLIWTQSVKSQSAQPFFFAK